MFGLMLALGLGEQEDAPIGDAADDAAGVEDKGAGCAGDSVGRVRWGRGVGERERWEVGRGRRGGVGGIGGDGLFDFCDVALADLCCC